MKNLSLLLLILAAIFGIVAAYKWYVASKVDFRPFVEINGKIVEVPTSDTQAWINAIRRSMGKSGNFNQQAALWTALSVGLAAVSGLLAAFAP